MWVGRRYLWCLKRRRYTIWKCIKKKTYNVKRHNAQARVQSPSLGSTRCIKAGLGYSVILGSEGKQNGVSRRGGLKDGQLNLQDNNKFAA